jgi:hypothetical protein
MLKKMTVISLLICSIVVKSQTGNPQLVSNSKADTWVAKDGIGRNVANTTQHGRIRKDKFVGVFYMIWQGAHGFDKHGKSKDEGISKKMPSDTLSPYDITKMLAKNPTNPQYGPIHAWHYWGEPYFGYYLSNDVWVIRKHGQMLADAGVDVLMLDVTNASIYLPQVTVIVETFRTMRKQGIATPSIAFVVNSQPEKTVQRLYENIYKDELFKDLWFYWKGKPLLLCPPEGLTDETANFFTSRHSWAFSKNQKWFADGKDKWSWIDHTPQSYGWHENKNKPEQISVAIAEHPTSNIGRSNANGKQPEKPQSGLGLHFAQQWDRALAVDPEFVFVTGWNEWVAMRFNDGRAKKMMDKTIATGETYFVDLYNAEFSRDAEPVKGDFNDNYYYQLVNNIRKFKGSRTIPTYTTSNTILVDGKFTDWDKVEAVFYDDKGDIFHRNHPGWGSIKAYINNSGRNDIVQAKITSDNDNIYFYVKTAKPLTAFNLANWMNLLIEVDSTKPNWEGFNFIVNHRIEINDSSTLKAFAKNNTWQKIKNINIDINKNELELAISKTALGIIGNAFTIDFKWTDNNPNTNAMQWLDEGDAAPNARFKYRYIKQ